ncbi:MAG TPA: pyridoxal-dependent decarboxylase [Gallionella sp.]|nr:pyridoxal-dependent decarboxylase [Gallionella sp.]
MDTRRFELFWQKDGTLHPQAPGWTRLRTNMRNAFPSPYRPTASDPLAVELGHAIQLVDALKPAANGPAFLGTKPAVPDYTKAEQATLDAKMATVRSVVNSCRDLFDGMPHWNHPLTMPNVVPPPNLAGIIGAMMTGVFNPNIIEGEYAWNVAESELECAAMLAQLIGWDQKTSRGLFTFGGTGCYLYALKYALTRVLGPDSRKTGIRTDAKLLVSQQGHYCKLNASDWSGLGMNNIIEIETDPDTNAMDLADLERRLQECQANNVPVALVVCTMGTTDANAMDPVARVRELIEKYPNPAGYGKTFLYCDAVIGWSWLTFGNYDFAANPLGFSGKVLRELQANYAAIRDVVHADAVGCDFHKVGWAPYNCSLFMYQDRAEFEQLMRRPDANYLQERTTYNPGLYTLEASRSGAGSMAAWATLKYFGYEGFQATLGGILEMQQYLRDLIEEFPEVVCVNPHDFGFVTLFRVYPPGTDARTQYQRELTDPAAKNELVSNNQLQQAVADRLWLWFRDGQLHAGQHAPYISYTSGFRPAEYNRDESDPDAMVYALKSYPMNLNINPASMQTLLKLVVAARDSVRA